MTDNELRALRDASRDRDLVPHFCNEIIRCRRNLRGITDPARRAVVQAHITDLEQGLKAHTIAH